MFTHLPFDLRLLIWETILHQPRIVHVNMRYLPSTPCPHCGTHDTGFECLCSTPIPALLHLCSETRTLALAYYDLTFGRADAPALRPRTVHSLGFSYMGKNMESVTESNEAEVATYAPRIYFNFQRDTLFFGRMLEREGDTAHQRDMACFPYEKHFESEQLQRIESLALSMDKGHMMLTYLNHHVGLGSFERLKNLYLCLEADNVDPSRELELLGARDMAKGPDTATAEDLAQIFVELWKISFERQGVVIVGSGLEALHSISRDGLGRQESLRDVLLRNGADSEELLKLRWLRNRL